MWAGRRTCKGLAVCRRSKTYAFASAEAAASRFSLTELNATLQTAAPGEGIITAAASASPLPAQMRTVPLLEAHASVWGLRAECATLHNLQATKGYCFRLDTIICSQKGPMLEGIHC